MNLKIKIRDSKSELNVESDDSNSQSSSRSGANSAKPIICMPGDFDTENEHPDKLKIADLTDKENTLQLKREYSRRNSMVS